MIDPTDYFSWPELEAAFFMGTDIWRSLPDPLQYMIDLSDFFTWPEDLTPPETSPGFFAHTKRVPSDMPLDQAVIIAKTASHCTNSRVSFRWGSGELWNYADDEITADELLAYCLDITQPNDD